MSKQLKCLLLDDEPPALRLLSNFVERVSFLKVAAELHDPLEALEVIEKGEIDVVFLDIQMPNLTGIQIAKIVKQKVRIIFTTAYPQFALESYEVNALDYLLKPFQFERFYEAALKLKASHDHISSNSNEAQDHIFVKTDGKNNFDRISLKEIRYVEASRNYIIIYLKDRRVITHNTLKYMENFLPNDQFTKVHKSYIVALVHVERTESQWIFINGKELPIGGTYRELFFERIGQRKL